MPEDKKVEVKLNIYQKIVLIRKSVGSLVKDIEANKYKYVKGSKILAKMQPMMDELNVLLIPDLGSKTEITQYTDKYRDGKDWIKWQYKNDMTYTWVDADNPDDKIVSHWDAIGVQEDPSQAFGSALTYAERYFLLKFLGIPTDEVDPDAKKPQKKEVKTEAPKLIQPDQITILRNQYVGDIFVKFLEKNKIQKIEEMDYEVAKGKIDNLNKLANELRAAKEANDNA